MSHSKIRKDKRCQNCGYFVAERFCPNCGQENTETRKRFHYLFVHFLKDFVHYDGLFWKTILALFVPAKLSREYLAGKRKSQVNPVQLYIFISFIVFFVPHILPDFNTSSKKHSKKNHQEKQEQVQVEKKIKDDEYDNIISKFGLGHIKSVEELDSIQSSLPKEKKLSLTKYAILEKLLYIKQVENPLGKIGKAVGHNISKAVFLYMPIFAFWLWLFHSKKKWFYFDHGIYTLHYFSFILLMFLLYIVTDWLLSFFHREIPTLVTIAMLAYFIYYFFHSHRRMYMETKTVSRLLCTILFFINTFCMILFLAFFSLVVAWISVGSH